MRPIEPLKIGYSHIDGLTKGILYILNTFVMLEVYH